MTMRKGSHEALVASEPDDIDAYVATFDDEEQLALSAAETAIDIAILLHRAREHRGRDIRL